MDIPTWQGPRRPGGHTVTNYSSGSANKRCVYVGGGGGGITRVRSTVDVSSPITHTWQVGDRSLSTRRGGGGHKMGKNLLRPPPFKTG